MKSQEAHSRFVPEGMTRDCLDPWAYVEFKTDGGVSLCCVRPPIGNIVGQSIAEILQSDEARGLRRDLLSGFPDSICRECGLKGVVTPGRLQDKVRMLQQSVKPPKDFDPAAYLEANPDVKTAGVDPTYHFLKFGRLEGRRLAP